MTRAFLFLTAASLALASAAPAKAPPFETSARVAYLVDLSSGAVLLSKNGVLRIVALTGWGQERDKEKARAAGFDMHLVKPVDAHQLGQALAGRNGATLH